MHELWDFVRHFSWPQTKAEVAKPADLAESRFGLTLVRAAR